MSKTATFETCAGELIQAGRTLHEQGLVPATSGNLSARLDADTIAITVSGRHKGHLNTGDIMRVDNQGRALDEGTPSAETGLHLQIYRRYPQARMVLHHHSLVATLVSQVFEGDLVLGRYELLKAFPGISTHEARFMVPVFDNDQDIGRLAGEVEKSLDRNPDVHGYLIRGHGLYTWGDSLSSAIRHVEAFEFLLKCELLKKGVLHP